MAYSVVGGHWCRTYLAQCDRARWRSRELCLSPLVMGIVVVPTISVHYQVYASHLGYYGLLFQVI